MQWRQASTETLLTLIGVAQAGWQFWRAIVVVNLRGYGERCAWLERRCTRRGASDVVLDTAIPAARCSAYGVFTRVKEVNNEMSQTA